MNNELTFKQKMALQSVKVLQKQMVKKGKKDIAKLYEKHEVMINELMDKFCDIVELENEKRQKQMVAMICANSITGFDTKAEMDIVVEMIKVTIEEYCKINNIN